MEGRVIVELIEPLIGKWGQVRLLFRGLNGRWTLNDDKHPSVAVQLRPDGLIETSRGDGWDRPGSGGRGGRRMGVQGG